MTNSKLCFLFLSGTLISFSCGWDFDKRYILKNVATNSVVTASNENPSFGLVFLTEFKMLPSQLWIPQRTQFTSAPFGSFSLKNSLSGSYLVVSGSDVDPIYFVTTFSTSGSISSTFAWFADSDNTLVNVHYGLALDVYDPNSNYTMAESNNLIVVQKSENQTQQFVVELFD